MYSDSFEFLEYDENNDFQKKALEELISDEETIKYFNNIEDKLKSADYYNHGYLVSDYIDIIGFVNVNVEMIKEAELQYAINPKYRGNHMGTVVARESADMLFKLYKKLQMVKLYIKTCNIASTKTAIYAGFKKVGIDEDDTIIFGKSRGTR